MYDKTLDNSRLVVKAYNVVHLKVLDRLLSASYGISSVFVHPTGYNLRKRAFDFLLVTAPDFGSFDPDLVTRQGRPWCSSQWQRGQKTNLHLSLLQVACCSSEGVEEEGRGGEGGVTQGAGLVTR